MIRITKVRQRLNSFARISLLVKFVFTGKSVDEKANYIIVPCRPLIANLQSRSCELASTLETRKKNWSRVPASVSGIVTGKAPVSGYWPVFSLSIVTVPEVNSAQFLAMVANTP